MDYSQVGKWVGEPGIQTRKRGRVLLLLRPVQKDEISAQWLGVEKPSSDLALANNISAVISSSFFHDLSFVLNHESSDDG